MRRARKEPVPARLHEWRKRVKDLWYHLSLLEDVAPNTVAAHANDAHLLSDLLGDDHDLAVLRDAVAAMSDELPVDTVAVLAAIDHRRSQLEEQAFYLGQSLYAESPKAFEKRLHAYWEAWRARARAAAARTPAELADATRAPAHH
jgi:CHAD domain-containing protein